MRFEAVDTIDKGMMGLIFQVSDVRKPLAAVWRICQKGNRVCFGPDEEDNYIENKGTKKKVMLRQKGGSYIMKVTAIREKNQGAQTFRGRA